MSEAVLLPPTDYGFDDQQDADFLRIHQPNYFRSASLDHLQLVEGAAEQMEEVLDWLENHPTVRQVAEEFKAVGDYFTWEHMQRVTWLSLAIGTRMGLSQEKLYDLGLVASIHDWGKIDPAIQFLIYQQRALSLAEKDQVADHPAIGVQFAQTQGISQPLLDMIANHHNDVKNPSLGLLILIAADVYDSLQSERPYRSEILPRDRALAIVEGRVCDPIIVGALNQATMPSELVSAQNR